MILSSLGFFIIPALVGYNLTVMFRRRSEKPDLALDVITWAQSFVYGSLLLFLELMLLQKLSLRIEYLDTILAFKILVAGQAVFALITAFVRHPKSLKKIITKKDLASVLLIFTLSLIGYFLIWKWNSPSNTTLNWDLYEHQTIVNLMRKGNINSLPQPISDTFQFYSYGTMFHTLLLTSQLLLKDVNVPAFWWHIEYWHYLLTILTSFVIGYIATKSRWGAAASAIVGAFVFESFIAYTSLFLIPQTLAATLLTLIIAHIILREQEEEREYPIYFVFLVVSTSIFLVLLHQIIGFAAIAILLFSILFLKLKRVSRILVIFFLAAIPITYMLTTNLNLNFLNHGEAENFNLTIKEKYEYAQEFYSYSLLLLYPIGLVSVLVKPKKSTEIVALISLGALSIVLAPLPYVLKFYTIGRYFVHAVIALGVWELIKHSKTWFKLTALSLLAVGLLYVFIVNVDEFKQNITYRNVASHVSEPELEAAKFIKENYSNNNALIISDPTTMYVMEGISGVNSPGGAFANGGTREVLSKIYLSRDSGQMKSQILKIKDTVEKEDPDVILLVISGRFGRWQQAEEEQKVGIVLNVWKPADLNLPDYEFIDFIDRYVGFKKVYRNNSLVIYEINR